MNAAEVGCGHGWRHRPGRSTPHSTAGRLTRWPALYAEDAAETDAARALQDETERTRGWRPDLATAKGWVHRPPAGELVGSTIDVVTAMNRYDPRWRTVIDHQPRDIRVTEPVRA